ncbi:MAG: beta-propeller domain-containing protein [Polyangiaceae bacterium]|nr:beta-propeller domain-containing protein [Polyangiaceae bacterium]
MRRRFRHPLALPLLLSLPTMLPLVACSDGSSGGRQPQRDEGGFFSDSPSGPSRGREVGDGAQDGGAGGGGGLKAPPEVVDRTIVEADIVQVKGNTLYALSRFAGLSIIDLSDAARPRLLGSYSMTGVPFEMYLQGTTVYAMFSSFGHYDVDDATGEYRWVQSSHVAALDTSDPANVVLAGEFDLPGEISDSRVVGDVLYAVTYEDGYCWRCEGGANTAVTSFAVGDPAAVRVVDRLRYTSEDESYGWSRRSVTVTPERMYIAGIEWDKKDFGGEGHSTIQVVDISDPGGKLVEGAKVEAAGQIESRWQMDEHAGILRVISQPGVWSTAESPVMQTFAVASSQSLVPISSKPMVLPKPERLRSVRFDGTRAFAITAERTDPLFALDFADPADPKQLGELEMPGWVYHLEVRGDRILALGFDNDAPEGALNVSLFDVSDMSAPRLAKRVHFGGDWGSYAEDQDRVHKAFTIVPELGLVLVPFSGWSQDQNNLCGAGTYQSGIQLVDFTTDDLTLRGVAPQKGEARRAFLHEGSLYAVSDEGVRSFGIENRDAPARRGELALASNVSRTVLAGAAGDKLVRFGVDWWTNEARLEIVSAAGADTTQPLGALDLRALAGELAANECRGSYLYDADLFTNGDYVYVTWADSSYYYDDGDSPGGGPQAPKQNVVVVSVADPANPVVVGRAALPLEALTSPGYYGGYGYGYGYGSNALVWSGRNAVAVGSTLVFESFAGPADGTNTGPLTAKLSLVDLADPTAPRLAGSLDWARGESFTGLVAQGSTLLASHAEPMPNAPGKVRFFVDRVDVSNPDAPTALPRINTPGSLLSVEGDRLVAVDYARFLVPAVNAEACYQAGYDSVFFDYENTACVRVERTFRLLDVVSSLAVPISDVAFPTQGYVTGVFAGDDRVFATTSPNYGYAYYYADGPAPFRQSEQSIFALGGMRDGTLRGTLTPVSSPNPWWWSSLRGHAAAGQRLIVSDYSSEPHLAVFDATNLDAPTFDEKVKLRGYLNNVLVTGDSAVCSLGQYGVQNVSLAP